MKILATADLHIGRFDIDPQFVSDAVTHDKPDLFLIAGDLTENGTDEEIQHACALLEHADVPTYCVMGNHDHELSSAKKFQKAFESWV